MRVIILAPIGRDAALLAGTLEALKIDTANAPNALALLEMLAEGAGSAIIAEEALSGKSVDDLGEWLAAQPPWSDVPFLVLTSNGRPASESRARAAELYRLGNFTVIERPVRPETVQSSVRAALRARLRQYEIRSRQEALVQANADLEQFAHSASHDLREPLRSISIYSEILARGYEDKLDTQGNEFLHLIHSSASRMDALLTDLLSYAHTSSIDQDAPAPVRAIRPLNTALDNLAGSIRESDAQIKIGPMPNVKMHESHLAQVFQNLVGNAIKYRRDNEQLLIELSALRCERYWKFKIADNGIGVPAAYKETIFGIFKRLHTNSKYSGTGMGLAICQRIIERYQGRIWVESEPGQGSDFFFTIPA